MNGSSGLWMLLVHNARQMKQVCCLGFSTLAGGVSLVGVTARRTPCGPLVLREDPAPQELGCCHLCPRCWLKEELHPRGQSARCAGMFSYLVWSPPYRFRRNLSLQLKNLYQPVSCPSRTSDCHVIHYTQACCRSRQTTARSIRNQVHSLAEFREAGGVCCTHGPPEKLQA